MCYLPCSDPNRKRERSAEILAEVAARFGYPQFAEGGIAGEIESWLEDDNS